MKKDTPRHIPSFEVSGLSEKEMEEARIRARRKLADDIAMAELGITDTQLSVKKGPLPIPGEDMFTVLINLEPSGASGDRLVVDGKIYMHGQSITVTRREYNSLMEMMSRGFQHQAEVDGKDSNAYRRKLQFDASTGRAQPNLHIPRGDL